jgi:RNase P subunit RPR2
MTCEQCHALMIERLPARENQDSDKEQAVVLECPQCGHTEYQPLITSFWRRLAA